VSLVNIILPIHFITIFLAGIVFVAFIESIKKKQWYTLLVVIFTFIFIEISQGLFIGTLSLISLFIYSFIKTKLKYILSYDFIFRFALVAIFYFLFFILFLLNGKVDVVLVYKLLANFVLDIVLIGLL
jgi:hypothetical protein